MLKAERSFYTSTRVYKLDCTIVCLKLLNGHFTQARVRAHTHTPFL